MRIGFVVARVGDNRNVVQKLAIALTKEMNKQGQQVEIVKFTKRSLFYPFWYWKLKKYNVVFIANVGLQCAYFCLLKRLRIISKRFIAFAFGSDIREVNNWLINFFNWLSMPAIDILVPINPDLVVIAKKRGYNHVVYVHNWAEALT